jgi:AmiR/NasT family two-component response regulator
MISAEANPENVSAARKAGVDGYVTKPFDAETLRDNIRYAMGARFAAAA